MTRLTDEALRDLVEHPVANQPSMSFMAEEILSLRAALGEALKNIHSVNGCACWRDQVDDICESTRARILTIAEGKVKS